MKTTKKQFKNLATQLICLLNSPEVDEKYANTWYRKIACDYALNFRNAKIEDYQFSIERLLELL